MFWPYISQTVATMVYIIKYCYFSGRCPWFDSKIKPQVFGSWLCYSPQVKRTLLGLTGPGIGISPFHGTQQRRLYLGTGVQSASETYCLILELIDGQSRDKGRY
jgi:hypothetical protein